MINSAVIHGPSGPFPTSEFEHSSIPATVKKIFNLPEFLTKRDEWAGTFDIVINRTTPRTDCPGRCHSQYIIMNGIFENGK